MSAARHSIAWRLAALYAVVSALSLIAVGAFLFVTLEQLLRERDAQELSSKLTLVRHYIAEASSKEDSADLRHRLDDLADAHPALSVALFDHTYRRLLSGRGFPIPPTALVVPSPGSQDSGSLSVWSTERGSYLAIAAWASTPASDRAETLVAVALDISGTRALLKRYQGIAFSSLAITMLLALLLGAAAARVGLRSLTRIAATASRISADKPGPRLGSGDVPVEAAPLIDAFDQALARIQLSYRQLSDFSYDLAHELRTPLHNLTLQTQVVLSRDRQPTEYRRVLEAYLEELERLSRMTNDMLFIARAENAEFALQKESIDVRSELESVVEFFEALAHERGVAIECAGIGGLLADRQLFRRAVSNLLSNAVRHTPTGGTISVSSRSLESGESAVVISNPGPGISEQHLSRVFDRFFRVDTVRDRTEANAGLGLSIVKGIMRLHGGAVQVASSKGGPTVFELRFPAESYARQ